MDVIGARRRHLPIHVGRLAKALKRDTRVQALKIKKVRTKVFNTAVIPQGMHGAHVLGMPPSGIQRFRSALSKHLGWRHGWCSTTLLQLEQPHRDPGIAYPLKVVNMFLDIWADAPELRGNIAQAWAKARAQLMGGCPHQRVGGTSGGPSPRSPTRS